jgi:hypothetical protein
MTPEEVRKTQEIDELYRRLAIPEERALIDIALSFAVSPNGLTALIGLREAAAAGLPLPPEIAHWLKERIDNYFDGTVDTLEEALGLESGRHSSVRRYREARQSYEAIALLHELAILGAPIDDAAKIVAAKCEVGETTLNRKYRDRNLELNRKVAAAGGKPSLASVEAVLAQYPDDLHRKRVKAAILKKLKK